MPVVVVVATTLGLLLGTGASLALFTDRVDVGSGTFGAGSIATPALPAATRATLPSTNVVVTWAATQVGPADGRVSAYDVLRYPSAAGGTAVVACSTGNTGNVYDPAAPPATTCTDTTNSSAEAWYALRSKVGASWTLEGSRTRYVTDTTAPTVTITTPVLTATCGGSVACGTSTDTGGGTVLSVEYVLRRARTPLLSPTTVTCWNGTAYEAAANNTDCAWRTAAGTPTAWSVPGSRTIAYPAAPTLGAQSWVLSVRATDTFGNVSTTVTSSFSN